MRCGWPFLVLFIFVQALAGCGQKNVAPAAQAPSRLFTADNANLSSSDKSRVFADIVEATKIFPYRPDYVLEMRADGSIALSNDSSLSRSVKRFTPYSGSLYRSSDGESIAVPNDVGPLRSAGVIGQPPPITTTGPYQRLYYQAGQGQLVNGALYAPPNGVGMVVVVPCGALQQNGTVFSGQNGPFGDTGYVYSGGWGGNGTTSLDIGFQFSSMYNRLNPFYKWGGQQLLSITNAPYYNCGDRIYMQFQITSYTVSNGSTPWYIVEFGDLTQNGPFLLLKFPFADNVQADINSWYQGYQILKVMTSIAQNTNTNAVNYDSGVNDDGFSFGVSSGSPSIQIAYNWVTDVGWLDRLAQYVQSVPYPNDILNGPATVLYQDPGSGWPWPTESVGISLPLVAGSAGGGNTPSPTPTPMPTKNPGSGCKPTCY